MTLSPQKAPAPPGLRRVRRLIALALVSALVALPSVTPQVAAQEAGGDGGTAEGTSDPGAGDAGAGTTGAGTTGAGTTGAGTTGAGPATPWAQVTDVPLPSFLDTTDRRIRDERPPPSAEQVAALREMEAEVDRFTKSGSSYRDAVRSILRREYLTRRRDREQGYARQIREEERLMNEARERAIRLFERFVREYPDDPTYTPDAMFRLGELYYERSAILFQDATLAGHTPAEGHPDFMPTIDTYRQLVQRFPNYRRIDGVYYLIGYCLNAIGELEEAVQAWLNLTCANHYTYSGRPVAPPPAPPGEEEAEAAAEEHPALGLDMTTPIAPDAPFVDPYTDCQPISDEAEFISETWLRIGEYHFDFDTRPHFLDRAIAAYSHVLADPEDRNYNLALYKVAWAYYRSSRYPEAIEAFAQLIDWSDREQERTGRAGSSLREEAVQYLAITFAYDDWNENQFEDPQEGLPTGFQRIQDPAMLPQDRPWTVEIYFQLGQVYFDEDRYPLAIEVWEYAIAHWPNHFRVPEYIQRISQAYERVDDRQRAIAALEHLLDYSVESEWGQANDDEHPREVMDAERAAEAVLFNSAVRHHEEAQRVRRRAAEAFRRGDTAEAEELLAQATAEYNAAAEGYRAYIRQYPNSPNAYELQYNLADALYWSEQYEEAAEAYASVRDSNLDDRYLSESARRVVESLHRILEAAQQRGEVEVRTEPPPVEPGTPPTIRPVEMPLLVQRMAQAREIYQARVDDAHDSEGLRGVYEYNNTILLYNYGWWDQARERLRRTYLERCTGPRASEDGRFAWLALRNIAVQMGDTAEVERLGVDFQTRACTFSPDGAAAPAVDCTDPANAEQPACLVTRDLNNICFQRALAIYTEAAVGVPEGEVCPATISDAQRRLFERSATDMLACVGADPNHPDVPQALIQAAVALECTSRFESASRLYQRVIDEVGPRRPSEDSTQEELDGILALAYFRLAYTANRFFDYDRAVESYRVIADSERFSRSSAPTIAGIRTDALINAARILEYQQQYSRAADYYRRAAEAPGTDQPTRLSAYFRVAEMSFKRRDWNGTIREMRGFIDRYQRDTAAQELVVTAYWRIAQARHEMNQVRDYRAALQDVVDAFARSGQTPGSIAAEYAAQAKFELVDPDGQAFESFAMTGGSPATLEAYVQDVTRQIQAGSARAQSLVTSYEPILAYRRPVWTIAALVKQGRIYEVLARAILNTPFAMPADLARRVRGASQEVRDEVRLQVEDRIRQVLDQQVRPVECFAVVRYSLAARAARAGSLDTPETRLAIDRLQAYGEERIGECLTAETARDPSFTAYSPGEFARARAAPAVPMAPGLAAPALAGEE